MNTSDMPVIELRGSALERGRGYGESVKQSIEAVVESWRADLGNFRLRSDSGFVFNHNPDEYINSFLSNTHYLRGIQRWSPTLLEEVKGIAEASGQDFKTILALQLVDEEWMFGLRKSLVKPTDKCTAFGIPRQQNKVNFSGQNMDMPSWVEGNQVLLRILSTNDSPEQLVFSYAGLIGLNGLNASGLGITCNTLAQLKGSIYGLPVTFIVRSILDHASLNEAEQFLYSIKHASGQNYIISSPDVIRCYECSATRVVIYEREHQKGRVFHTNHPLVNEDKIDGFSFDETKEDNSRARLLSITNRLDNLHKKLTITDIKSALAAHDDPDHPVSRRKPSEKVTDSIGYTAGSSIYELTVPPKLHIAAGPPCETNFETYIFSDYFLS